MGPNTATTATAEPSTYSSQHGARPGWPSKDRRNYPHAKQGDHRISGYKYDRLVDAAQDKLPQLSGRGYDPNLARRRSMFARRSATSSPQRRLAEDSEQHHGAIRSGNACFLVSRRVPFRW